MVFSLLTTFFSFTRLFWNHIVTCRSDRLVWADILLLLSFVINLLAAYSRSSSFSCTFVYGTRFFLPRRYEPESPPVWDTASEKKNDKKLS